MNIPLAKTVRDGAHSLFHAITGRMPTRAAAEHYRFSLPEHLTGMGILYALDVELVTGRNEPYMQERWEFLSPFPRLAFEHVSKDASRRSKRSPLWIIGGSYFYSPQRGLVSYAGPSGFVRGHVADADPTARERYERTHGGLAPREHLFGTLRVDQHDTLVRIAKMRGVIYDTDKSAEDRARARTRGEKLPPFEHPFESHAQPDILVTGRGDQLIVAGGDYTVTAHGIEDRA